MIQPNPEFDLRQLVARLVIDLPDMVGADVAVCVCNRPTMGPGFLVVATRPLDGRTAKAELWLAARAMCDGAIDWIATAASQLNTTLERLGRKTTP